MQLEESSGTHNKVVEGSVEGRQERGFTAHAVKTQAKGALRSVAPAGVVVPTSPELQDAIADVRRDDNPTNWVLAGFEGGDIKRPLVVIATGTGKIDEIRQLLDDTQVMYALYRTTDVYDDIQTVKFVYVYWWVGPAHSNTLSIHVYSASCSACQSEMFGASLKSRLGRRVTDIVVYDGKEELQSQTTTKKVNV